MKILGEKEGFGFWAFRTAETLTAEHFSAFYPDEQEKIDKSQLAPNVKKMVTSLLTIRGLDSVYVEPHVVSITVHYNADRLTDNQIDLARQIISDT